MSVELKGRIENVVYKNDSNDYTVLEIATEDNELAVAVGTIPMAFEGECVLLRGSWTFHKEFGRQFSFDSYEKQLPEDSEGILQYLSSSTVKGVGPVTALKIVNRFGSETFDVIENHPEWLADIPGITMKKAAAISESFREQTGIRNVMMFCRDYIAPTEVTKIYKHYGIGSVGMIQENPYILCRENFGISFEKADRFAKSLGVPLDDENRVFSGMKYLLTYNMNVNGHTCLPAEKLSEAAASVLEISAESAEAYIRAFIRDGRLATYSLDGRSYIMTCEVDMAENYIAEKLSVLEASSERFSVRDVAALVEKAECDFCVKYADLQREAIFRAIEGGVMILTGGPGTGKTTVIRALISIFESISMKTVLCAPTGRAAKRMSEATSRDAKTIHRMLEMEKGSDGEIRFNRNSRNPIDESVIIVDEVSMIDLALMDALLRAMRRDSKLILIGDSDQLPSVGAGNILADLIESELIPTVRLTEIFRQSKESLIVSNAHRINSGEPPILTATDSDFFFVRREIESDIPATIASLITERLPKTYGERIRGNIQVITPSKKGFGGVQTLNLELQSKINPPGKFKQEREFHGGILRVGDRVMQTENDYDIEWEKMGVSGTGVFNGDIGVVTKIDNPREKLTVRFEDDRVADYAFSELDELDLAYAITVHKSQGSEYPVVIIPVYSCAPMLMTRNLLYTAVTRAKNMVILVGRADIPAKMVENKREVMRYTTLSSRIKDYF